VGGLVLLPVARIVVLVVLLEGSLMASMTRNLASQRASSELLARQGQVGCRVGIRMLAMLLGHMDPAVTMRRYTLFFPSDVRALDVDCLFDPASSALLASR
jgi:hypothetical protein